MEKKTTIYIGLGTNLGNRSLNLHNSQLFLAASVGTIIAQSSIYETKAWGVEGQPDFLNQAILVKTLLLPNDLLATIHQIEAALGRERHQKWHERTIDIDILFYNEQIIQSKNLTIPHPQIAFRNFVLIPMLDIAADFVHPVLEVPMDVLYWKSKDKQEVWIYEN